MEYICVAKLIKPFGLKGEMKCEAYTDFASERFKKGSTVYLYKGESYIPMIVEKYRWHKGALLLSFKDYLDINLIEKYRNYEVYKSSVDIKPLKEGEYYFSDLVDLAVYNGNDLIGKVVELIEGPKYNYLKVLKTDDKHVLIPFVPFYILNVDLDNAKIMINCIEGLIWNLQS